MALNFFVVIMFSQWESLRKNSTIFQWLWSQNAGNGILEAQILSFFPGAACPWTPREENFVCQRDQKHNILYTTTMNMTLVADAILDSNSNQYPRSHAPTSIYYMVTKDR